jgi:hypothetical protein
MKSWTEFHIAVVYYSGLAASLLLGVLSLWYLYPFYYIKKVTERFSALWTYNFVTTVLIAGILGAMSVHFTDCHGDYDNLLNSPSPTIFYGQMEISTASKAYAIILSVWLVIFIMLQMIRTRPMNLSLIYKIITVALAIAGIFWFYDFRRS